MGKWYQKYLIVFLLFISVTIPENDSKEQKNMQANAVPSFVSLQGMEKNNYLHERYLIHKPSSLGELLEICIGASNEVVVFGGGATFNFGNDYVHLNDEYSEEIYYSHQILDKNTSTMTISNTKLPIDITLISTVNLKTISMYLEDDEPYVWADAGVTFGSLTQALHRKGYQFFDGPGFADITLGAATTVKAHGSSMIEFIDSVKEVHLFNQNTNSVINFNETDQILSLNATDPFIVLRIKLVVEEVKSYLTSIEYSHTLSDLYLGTCLLTEECSSFQHFGSDYIRIDKTRVVETSEKLKGKTAADMYLEWLKIRMCSWLFDAPTVPCKNCSHTRQTGFLWPEHSYEASFPILTTIETFYTTINSEIYIHKNHVNTTLFSQFVRDSDAVGRVEIRKQNEFLWIDIVVIELKHNFGILKLKENSIMDYFFKNFEGKPFYQHEGKRIFSGIPSYSFAEVRRINGANIY